ncbi:MAG: HvfC/BufC N-terminal domain-containing protein [Chromatiales bacterium]
MSSLRNLQRRFAESLIDPQGVAAEADVRPNGMRAAARLRVYRNNVYASLTSALSACYPVVERLVGEDFFSFIARRYVRENPSRSGNLHDYGGRFSEFLVAPPNCAGLAYLPEVARVEWAIQEVYHAAEPARADLVAMTELPPDRYADVRFRVHPASRLLTTKYPALRIWQVNQPGYRGDDVVSLDDGGDYLLVIRRRQEIELERLSAGEFVLLRELAQGRTVTYACEHALAMQPDLNLPARLRHHVMRQTLTGFYL